MGAFTVNLVDGSSWFEIIGGEDSGLVAGRSAAVISDLVGVPDDFSSYHERLSDLIDSAVVHGAREVRLHGQQIFFVSIFASEIVMKTGLS